jgi:hypothetical protein
MKISNLFTFSAEVVGVASLLFNGARAANIGALNNQCLDVNIANTWTLGNGQGLQIWQCSNSDNQNYVFANNALKVGKDLRYCVDVPGGQGYNGAKLQIWQCSGGPNQNFAYLSNGAIKWMPNGQDSNLCLDVSNNQFTNGNALQLYQCFYGKNQIYSYGGVVGAKNVQGGSTVTNQNQNAIATGGSSNTAWVKQLFPTKRLLSWAENDQYYNNLNKGPKIVGLMHWEHGQVAGNNKLWLPQFWGDRRWNEWNQRKAEIKASGKVPPVVLSFNEPDLAIGQNSDASAGIDPYWAAQLHKKEVEDVFRPMGSKIIGPQWGSIWNEDYINKFMGECQKLGCKFDGIGLHHYETMKDGVDAAVRNTIAQVEKAYERFKLPLFITELGFASSGGGSDQQFIEYLQKIGRYLDNTDKVAVWSLSAVQRKGGSGWGNDGGFMSSSFCFFNSDYSVTDLGMKYMYDSF